jgi:hypothetical protein
MKFISKEGPVILAALLEGLNNDLGHDGEDGAVCTKKIQNSKSFMPVMIEFLQKGTPNGDLFSLCHYYEQNGDLMRDPEITIYRREIPATQFSTAETIYYPATYRQDGLGIDQEFFRYDDSGKITAIATRQQTHCATFCTQWLKNIKQQQDIKVSLREAA